MQNEKTCVDIDEAEICLIEGKCRSCPLGKLGA